MANPSFLVVLAERAPTRYNGMEVKDCGPCALMDFGTAKDFLEYLL